MVRNEPRRVVGGRARARDPRIVLVALARALELPNACHDMTLGRPARQTLDGTGGRLTMRGIGVKLDTHRVRVETAEEELDRDIVIATLGGKTKGAKACFVPVLGQMAPPLDELDTQRPARAVAS